MNRELTSSEVLKLATEILKWKFPMLMTNAKLNKIKLVVGSAITQTHDHMNQVRIANNKSLRVGKSKASISEIDNDNAGKSSI